MAFVNNTTLFLTRLPFAGGRRTNRCGVRATIEEEVRKEMTDAMKRGDKSRLRALRGIRATFLNAEKEVDAKEKVSDEVAIVHLRRLAKMRRESIDMFEKGGRLDLADLERAELQVISTWLPVLADRDVTTVWARRAVVETGAKDMKDMGKVMAHVMKLHKQEVDGNVLRQVVCELLVSN